MTKSFAQTPAVATTPATVLDRTQRSVTGRITRVIYRDAESGFVILRITGGSDGVVVKGEWDTANDVDQGETYRFHGEWVEDNYGQHFRFGHVEVVGIARTTRGILRYLSATAGLSEAVSKKLLNRFGAETLRMCGEFPDAVIASGILSPETAKQVAGAIASAAKFESIKLELLDLFTGLGFGRTLPTACVRKWGRRAAEFVRRDPFKMLVAGLPSAGFKRCDALWQHLGRPADSLRRQFFCAWHAVRSFPGDTWVMTAVVGNALRAQFGARARVADVITLGVRAKWFVARENDTAGTGRFLAERAKADAERRIATQLHWLMQASVPHGAEDHWRIWPDSIDGLGLTDHQRDLVTPLLQSRVAILAGTPGTGKTWTAAALIRAVASRGVSVAVAAPTGKAAVRIGEYLARNGVDVAAMTIHKLLEYTGDEGFKRNREAPLTCQLLVVDESSMIDTSLMASLLDAVPLGCHVLFLGDPYQLPPVGHGAPLRDMIAANVPHAVLHKIERNDGMIVQACAKIKDGRSFRTATKINADTGENLRWIYTTDGEETIETLRTVVEGIRTNGRYNPVWDVQVLVALNERGEVPRARVNRELQALLNPLREGETETHNGFRLRDKIICLRNGSFPAVVSTFSDETPTDAASYTPDRAYGATQADSHYLANGDQGEVVAIDAKHLVAKFRWPDRLVRIPVGKAAKKAADADGGDASAADTPATGGKSAGNLADFALAYSVTVHKSQGSSWPVVIVLIDQAAGMVACREHHYTAISRAERVCLLIGPRAALAKQVARTEVAARRTYLRELIESVLQVKVTSPAGISQETCEIAVSRSINGEINYDVPL